MWRVADNTLYLKNYIMQEQIVRLIKSSYMAMRDCYAGKIWPADIVEKTLNDAEVAIYPEYKEELEKFLNEL